MIPILSPKTPHHQSQRRLRSPSPNYFGLVVDPTNTTVRTTGATPAKSEWPASSSPIRSAAGSSPQIAPLHANLDFDAFRRHSEQHQSNSARKAIPNRSDSSSPRAASKHHSSSRSSDKTATTPPKSIPTNLPSLPKSETLHNDEFTQASRSPKRLLSTDSHNVLGGSRRQSPADFNETASARSFGSPPRRLDDKNLRMSLPGSNVEPPLALKHHRAETLPTSLESQSPVLLPPQSAAAMLDENGDKVLLLDLRVATQYAQSHVKGALNLCIPTTLLKRSSYNVQRLADTFKEQDKKDKFSDWRSHDTIIAYDHRSVHIQEAHSCSSILKKFASEGWEGQSYIIRGGFLEFSRSCPGFVDDNGSGRLAHASSVLAIRAGSEDLPPVIGGCPMPATKNAANPFFGNIRQNMDLIGGVGQMTVHLPADMSDHDRRDLPRWLRVATDDKDSGKTVADKFFHIEKSEQKRMQEALSADVIYEEQSEKANKDKVQIAGIEKGSKNRYNNIFPYEHSRVKLKGVPKEGCDYVNASFLKTSLSNKKYIATQGPIPATFGDFWNMVWQRDVRVIVMLTAESEGGQIKAHNYWNARHYGPVTLHYHSEHKASLDRSRMHRARPKLDTASRRSSYTDKTTSGSGSNPNSIPPSPKTADEPFVLVRRFTVSHSDHPFERMREITQLQYTNWPDFGAPAHPAHLLALVEQCDSVVRRTGAGSHTDPDEPRKRPILVHCSAGCGRTGTFCTVDTVVDALKRQRADKARARHTSPMQLDDSTTKTNLGKENPFFDQQVRGAADRLLLGDEIGEEDVDLVEKAVEEFRVQRLSMVQSLRQYVLCYESVLEWIATQGPPKTA